MSEFDSKSLENLSPEVRARIEATLANTLEKELALEAAAGADPSAKFSRSRGAIFSRSKTGKVAFDAVIDPSSGDAEIVSKVEAMDDQAFKNFAERLSKLRDISKR